MAAVTTRRQSILLLGLLLLLAACAKTPEPEPAALGPLRLLLTNDDGVGAPGITALQRVLLAAGHKVVTVAPDGNRSGAGVSLTTNGTLTLREVEPGVYAVGGTPADCVRLALTTLLDEPVDLVVSGVNFGQNVGSGTVSSGTVGAAITAVSLGVPAVAVSQMVDPEDVTRTGRYFPDAAAFTGGLVAALAKWSERPLLPRWTVLNVNHPARLRADVRGVRLTHQGRATLYELDYAPVPGGYSVSFARSEAEETVPAADTTALDAGYITITPLDGSWTAREDVIDQLEGLPIQLEGAHSP